MKRISSSKQIEIALKKIGLSEILKPSDSAIFLQEYETGELIYSPTHINKNVLFIIDGCATVYLIDENDVLFVAARESAGCMMGDPELFIENYNTVFVEARTRLTALAIPYRFCLDEIKNNEKFMHFFIRQILLRENRRNEIEAEGNCIRDKVLFYIGNLCPDRCLKSITGAAEVLKCSYRQVQRAIKDLCDEGLLEKTGKGKYYLK